MTRIDKSKFQGTLVSFLTWNRWMRGWWMAYLLILTIQARAKKNFWCDVGTDAACDPAVTGEVDRLLLLLRQQI